MDRPPNKTLFELHEEENKHKNKDRRNLIMGVVIFILMLPVDYIIIKEVTDYQKEKARQKEVSVPISNNEPSAPPNEVVSQTAAESTVIPQNKPVQIRQTKRTADGWLKVNGKRYIIDGKTIIEAK